MSPQSEFYRPQRSGFPDLFVVMRITLYRNESISDFELARIEERLEMYNHLWEESPMIQEERAEYYERGEVKALQRLLVRNVQRRFPKLTELAQEKTKFCNKLDALDALFEGIQVVTDAQAVQQLLTSIRNSA